MECRIFFDFIFPSLLYGTVKYGGRSGTRTNGFVVFPASDVQRRHATFISHYRFSDNNYCRRRSQLADASSVAYTPWSDEYDCHARITFRGSYGYRSESIIVVVVVVVNVRAPYTHRCPPPPTGVA